MVFLVAVSFSSFFIKFNQKSLGDSTQYSKHKELIKGRPVARTIDYKISCWGRWKHPAEVNDSNCGAHTVDMLHINVNNDKPVKDLHNLLLQANIVWESSFAGCLVSLCGRQCQVQLRSWMRAVSALRGPGIASTVILPLGLTVLLHTQFHTFPLLGQINVTAAPRLTAEDYSHCGDQTTGEAVGNRDDLSLAREIPFITHKVLCWFPNQIYKL